MHISNARSSIVQVTVWKTAVIVVRVTSQSSCPCGFKSAGSVSGTDYVREIFTEWTFEARESEQSPWHVLYEHDGDMLWRRSEPFCADAFFPVEAFTCTSCRIRVGSHAQGHGCMHLRGFELFGAVLPPWRFFDVVDEDLP